MDTIYTHLEENKLGSRTILAEAYRRRNHA